MGSVPEFIAGLLFGAVEFIDGLPVYMRAFFAAGLLAAILRFWESRICEAEVLYSVSFRKSAFIALLAMPLLVWWFPGSRMVVFVDELPVRSSDMPWGWLLLFIIWASGFAVTLFHLIRCYHRARRSLRSLPELAEDNPLSLRLSHWQQQLGINRKLTLVLGSTLNAHHLLLSHRIEFPANAQRWSSGVQDLLLIRTLCHLKRHHSCWHALAQLTQCCYWPVTWVQRMHERMIGNFQLEADSLAESCYRDALGYERALKQLAEKNTPVRSFPPAAPAPGEVAKSGIHRRARDYWQALRRLWQPTATLELDFQQLFASRAVRDQQRKAEPYDKVFWFVGQAVVLALLFSGPTLRQTPPEIEQEFNMDFQLLWMENFHRNLERQEQLPLPDETDKRHADNARR
jgi:hypothetical protein